NKGLTLIIFLSDINVEARIVTDGEGIGWDNPYAAFKAKVEDIDYFGDKQWHKVAMSHKNGSWTLTVDGVNLFDGITEEQSAALDSFVGGDTGYISFGSNSGKGQYMICSGSYADERIAEQTKAPDVSDEAPATFAPEPTVETEQRADTTNKPASTEKPSNQSGASNGNTAIYIIAGVIAVIAVAVIIILIAKSKKK
ncbi:MAG: hypothetical protein IKS28_06075, partial [Clostridia bacterium]|nr:hypothetical protein [Clostridia bacterium]